MHISRISTVNSFFEKSKTNPNNFNGGVEYSNKLLNFVTTFLKYAIFKKKYTLYICKR